MALGLTGQSGGGLGAGLGGSIGGLIGMLFAGEGGEKRLKEALRIWNKLETSNFDMRSLSPPEIRIFAEAFPEVADRVMVGGPALPEESLVGRGAQLRGLERFETLAREGLPTAQRLAVEESQRQVAGSARSLDEQILQDLAQRGRLGAGDEISARLAGSSAAQNLAATQGRDLAEMRIANMLGGTEAAAGLGGQIRAGDIGLSSRRADAMNRFNELASTLGTQAARQNALARERAQMFNVGTRQRTGEEQEYARYGTQRENVERQNALRNLGFQQAVTKATGQTGALYSLGGLEELKRRERIALGQSLGQTVGGFAGYGLGAA